MSCEQVLTSFFFLGLFIHSYFMSSLKALWPNRFFLTYAVFLRNKNFALPEEKTRICFEFQLKKRLQWTFWFNEEEKNVFGFSSWKLNPNPFSVVSWASAEKWINIIFQRKLSFVIWSLQTLLLIGVIRNLAPCPWNS